MFASLSLLLTTYIGSCADDPLACAVQLSSSNNSVFDKLSKVGEKANLKSQTSGDSLMNLFSTVGGELMSGACVIPAT